MSSYDDIEACRREWGVCKKAAARRKHLELEAWFSRRSIAVRVDCWTTSAAFNLCLGASENQYVLVVICQTGQTDSNIDAVLLNHCKRLPCSVIERQRIVNAVRTATGVNGVSCSTL